jgi:hypothetical protein
MAGPGNLFEGQANGALSERSNARESKGSREGGLLIISTNGGEENVVSQAPIL